MNTSPYTGDRIVALRVKSLLAVPACHNTVLVGVMAAGLPLLFPANARQKVVDESQSIWNPATHLRDLHGSHGFWFLSEPGPALAIVSIWGENYQISLLVSHCVSVTVPLK